jgi:hypothetical protein
MKSFQELSDQSNKARVDLLLADAEMALTLLDVAHTSNISELKQRRTDEARKAYSFIQEQIPTVSLTPSETAALNEKMAVLKLRLSLV